MMRRFQHFVRPPMRTTQYVEFTDETDKAETQEDVPNEQREALDDSISDKEREDEIEKDEDKQKCMINRNRSEKVNTKEGEGAISSVAQAAASSGESASLQGVVLKVDSTLTKASSSDVSKFLRRAAHPTFRDRRNGLSEEEVKRQLMMLKVQLLDEY